MNVDCSNSSPLTHKVILRLSENLLFSVAHAE